MQGTLDGAAGELQVGGNRFYRGPAVSSFACPVTKIDINTPRPMGKLIGRGRINVVNLCGQKPLQHNGFHCTHYQKIVIEVVKTLLSAKLVFFTNSGLEAFCVSAFCFWSVEL